MSRWSILTWIAIKTRLVNIKLDLFTVDGSVFTLEVG